MVPSQPAGGGRPAAVHVDLDGAATSAARELGLPTLDARAWGPRLRFCAPARLIEAFYREFQNRLAPFTLFGSGDFHHLSALWLRPHLGEPLTLVSFDNHPDWDIRPPRWACGGWLKRALDSQSLESATVWGCGNFELAWPGRVFRLRDPRLSVRPWGERLAPADRARYRWLERSTWRAAFAEFAAGLAGRGARIYVTIDLDCLTSDSSVSDWEHGLFEPDDLVWAMGELRRGGRIVGGDVCGASSLQHYARWTQALAAWWDHPPARPGGMERAEDVNRRAMAGACGALFGV